jgi:hypothetical protein
LRVAVDIADESIGYRRVDSGRCIKGVCGWIDNSDEAGATNVWRRVRVEYECDMNDVSRKYKKGEEVKVEVGGARENDDAFPKKIIIRYPVFVRVFAFFPKTNGITERFERFAKPCKRLLGHVELYKAEIETSLRDIRRIAIQPISDEQFFVKKKEIFKRTINFADCVVFERLL